MKVYLVYENDYAADLTNAKVFISAKAASDHIASFNKKFARNLQIQEVELVQ